MKKLIYRILKEEFDTEWVNELNVDYLKLGQIFKINLPVASNQLETDILNTLSVKDNNNVYFTIVQTGIKRTFIDKMIYVAQRTDKDGNVLVGSSEMEQLIFGLKHYLTARQIIKRVNIGHWTPL